ncbi:MAG: hypothetical protein NTV06_01835 [candidate division Zixibacteria bacterium]|nr:hypothetical protein [candidate division Zixibacteria bacterium]
MIEILIDNNAFVQLCVRDNYDGLVSIFNNLYKENKLGINFNILAFLEQLEGTNSDAAFNNARDRICKAGKLTSKNLLLPPDDYARMAIGILSEDETKTIGKNWFNVFESLCICSSRSDFNETLQNLKKEFRSKKDEFGPNMLSLQILSSEIFQRNNINDIEKFLLDNKPVLANVRKKIFDKVINSLMLNMARKIYPSDLQFRKSAFCLCVYVNVYINYLVKICRKAMTARESDEVDLLQTIYLASCDYLITEDKQYRDLINNNPFDDYLHGRAIDVASFLNMIEDDSIFRCKRAADNHTRLKFA